MSLDGTNYQPEAQTRRVRMDVEGQLPLPTPTDLQAREDEEAQQQYLSYRKLLREALLKYKLGSGVQTFKPRDLTHAVAKRLVEELQKAGWYADYFRGGVRYSSEVWGDPYEPHVSGRG